MTGTPMSASTALVVTPAPSYRHQEIVGHLHLILSAACSDDLKVLIAVYRKDPIVGAQETDVRRLVSYINENLPTPWPTWPGGYPDQVELALIDAVLSIQARYGSPSTGVRPRVRAWRDKREGGANDLMVLAETDPTTLADILDTRQRLRGGSTKAQGIVFAARNFVDVRARHSGDINPRDPAQKRAYVEVRGLGPVTWEYFSMLLGMPGVKADTWITRFVSDALGSEKDSKSTADLVKAAAKELQRSPTDLDHAIWRSKSR